MTDEEKKAIDKLKRSANYFVMPIYETKIILELIEKQSKEIEELEKNRKVSQNFAKIVATDYISKDKIKAKIEEVEQCELYNMKIPRLSTLDERLGAKIGIKYVLQSLLEKE